MNSQNLPPPSSQQQSQEQQPSLRSQYAQNPSSNGLNGAHNSYTLNGAVAGLTLGNASNSFSQSLGQNPNPNSMAAAAAAANGMMGNRAQWPSTGDQMDMQVLWELINNIADVQQGIREQTNGVLQRVQMIQARGDEGMSEAVVPNGITISTGAPPANAKERAYLDEISSLRSQLSSTTTDLTNLTTQHQSLVSILQQHESTLSTLLTKLRPYATHHTQALESQKAHYLSLLESERSQNLDLRLEVSRLQDGLGKVLGLVRAAEQEENGKERKWVRQLAGVKAENRVLRGVCGVAVDQESSESESEGEEEWVQGMMEMAQKMGVVGGGVGMKRS